MIVPRMNSEDTVGVPLTDTVKLVEGAEERAVPSAVARTRLTELTVEVIPLLVTVFSVPLKPTERLTAELEWLVTETVVES
jgi:hypothetical protein